MVRLLCKLRRISDHDMSMHYAGHLITNVHWYLQIKSIYLDFGLSSLKY